MTIISMSYHNIAIMLTMNIILAFKSFSSSSGGGDIDDSLTYEDCPPGYSNSECLATFGK